MGFTPLEGLVMATRSGSVDPGILLWLLEHESISERELADALEHESGLLGLAGSADMREVLGRADSGEQNALLALEVYIHRLSAAIASMTAALGGLDVLVFTGGVGEYAPAVRSRAAASLEAWHAYDLTQAQSLECGAHDLARRHDRERHLGQVTAGQVVELGVHQSGAAHWTCTPLPTSSPARAWVNATR